MVVDERVLDAGAREHLGKIRLPYPLREPGSPRGHPEPRLQVTVHPLDLPLLIPRRDHGEDRLVKGPRQELHLAAAAEHPQGIENRRLVLLEPLEEGPRPMHGQAYARMASEGVQERPIRPLDRFGEDRIEIPDRLMVVDRNGHPDRRPLDGHHAAPPSRGARFRAGFVGRSWAVRRTPSRSRARSASRSAELTWM